MAIKKVLGQEYIHATVAGALTLIYLWFGIKRVEEIAPPLSDSLSDTSDSLAAGEDGSEW